MHRTLRRMIFPLLLLLLAACGDGVRGPLAPGLPPPSAGRPHPDRAALVEAARAAWAYAEREYQPSTGLINPVAGYPVTTAWDIASGLAALYCARELGLLAPDVYDTRMSRALATLRSIPLFDDALFSRHYLAGSAQFARSGGEPVPVQRGSGWSATDLGRLLVWLRIIAENQPRYAGEVRAIVARLDLARVVGSDGYLRGGQLSSSGSVATDQEGRIGYEQYAAYGLALWGRPAERALRLHENTLPITVLGVPLVADRRGHDVLTSEPFVLAGLEVGWSGEMRELAQRVLEVQEERHRRTGQVTVVSEDNVPVPPHYFYYYSINFHGSAFVVLPPEQFVALDSPRWVSTKAAFGWHALLPGDYTQLAVAAVAPALIPGRGWSSGVYEKTGEPTGALSLNTAAVILEAALYATTGRPLLYGK